MTKGSEVASNLERLSVVPMESTIPADMTISSWRRSRSCTHLHDTTTRYDRERKLLRFLLVCHACGTEKEIKAIPYEPRYTPQATGQPSGAKIYQFPQRRRGRGLRQAA